MPRLLAGHYNIALDLSGTLDREVTAVAHENVEIGQDFELIPGVLVNGTVTGADGEPKAGIEVGVYGPAHPNSSAWVQSATTDKSGHYVFRVPAGKNRVYVMSGPIMPEGSDRTIEAVDGQETKVDFVVK
jgi:hypothetical protein